MLVQVILERAFPAGGFVQLQYKSAHINICGFQITGNGLSVISVVFSAFKVRVMYLRNRYAEKIGPGFRCCLNITHDDIDLCKSLAVNGGFRKRVSPFYSSPIPRMR